MTSSGETVQKAATQQRRALSNEWLYLSSTNEFATSRVIACMTVYLEAEGSGQPWKFPSRNAGVRHQPKRGRSAAWPSDSGQSQDLSEVVRTLRGIGLWSSSFPIDL